MLSRFTGKPFGQDMDVEELNFPLADNDQSIYNFPNSSGLHFEADHVFECLRSSQCALPHSPCPTRLAFICSVQT
jgi:hypothetical protein